MLCGVGKRGACLWVIVLAGPCQADLPLMIDDLLTPEESLRFELGVVIRETNEPRLPSLPTAVKHYEQWVAAPGAPFDARGQSPLLAGYHRYADAVGFPRCLCGREHQRIRPAQTHPCADVAGRDLHLSPHRSGRPLSHGRIPLCRESVGRWQEGRPRRPGVPRPEPQLRNQRRGIGLGRSRFLLPGQERGAREHPNDANRVDARRLHYDQPASRRAYGGVYRY